ncbi:MAG: hypothetical protein IKW59_03120 [Clostridia bacterium]|nr:hypothetical protein [Clostridia bacterium]
METLSFNLSNKRGAFKPLNAACGAPWHKRGVVNPNRSNLRHYKEARIPYCRNHDQGFSVHYGHDISKIFRYFDADAYDPDSYDFACTDDTVLKTLEAGTEMFYRLGECIEHEIKKHFTVPPKDFKKWAVICEHIIRHYNEGWADGFKLNIKYWEIWNEPDLGDMTWGGTKEQFFEFYITVAKHLRECFPNIKIGGPSLAWDRDFLRELLDEAKKADAPLDFFTWHVYPTSPEVVVRWADEFKEILTEKGFGNAESMLTEFNFRSDDKRFDYCQNARLGIKGAAFLMATMSLCQKASSIDMLFYYCLLPSSNWNGVFDYHTYAPKKSYYPLKWYGMFYDMDAYIPCENEIENIYTLCGVDKDNKALCVVTYYPEYDGNPEKEISLDFGKEGSKYEIYLLDGTKDGEYIKTTDDLSFVIRENSCILIKEV